MVLSSIRLVGIERSAALRLGRLRNAPCPTAPMSRRRGFFPEIAKELMVPACGIKCSSEIVGALRRSVIGVAQQRLSDADMLRVVNRQLGGNQLAKEVRIEIAAELAFCYPADDLSHFLCGQRLAGEADPEGI